MLLAGSTATKFVVEEVAAGAVAYCKILM